MSEIFQKMVVQGGFSFCEWKHLKDLGIVDLYLNGLNLRERSIWVVGRVLAQVIASVGGAKIEKDFPYPLPWDSTSSEDVRDDAEKQADLDRALELFNKQYNGKR